MKGLGFFIYLNSMLLAMISVGYGVHVFATYNEALGIALGLLGMNVFGFTAWMGLRLNNGLPAAPWKSVQ